jgi:hypothetical protein
MRIETNPIINIDTEERYAIAKTIRICDELIDALARMTISDEAFISCADNGEVLITEKELYTMYHVLTNMDRIFNDAPSAIDGSGYKELAINFRN